MAAEAAEAEAQAAEARAEAARARVRAAESRRRARTAPQRPVAVETQSAQAPAEQAAAEDEPGEQQTPGHRADTHSADPAQPTTSADDHPADIAHPAEAESLPRRTRFRSTLIGRLRSRSTMVAAALVVIALALTGSGYSIRHHHDITENDRRAAEFTAAARQGVVALTTLDFKRANEDVQRVLDNSTGSFRGDFQARATDFTTVIQQSQVATEGKVNATAIESMTKDSAVVLVAATSQVTNSAGARQEPRAWRLSVTVTRDGDQLKMSKVEFVP
ncbi:hypothetical protein HGB38_02775 [Nocardia gamkensis]|uniref:VirB8 protein n=1 Tax=Nocardia gamkensis TaxID=352869 RepID=A0A7X6KZU7_9NOCA|nr:hypothetical protein [Nocardia gamkensis]